MTKCTCPHGRPWFAQCYHCMMARSENYVRTTPVYLITQEGWRELGRKILRNVSDWHFRHLLD